ncbi:CLUMA_CG015748, isoform A [Clunio marinus]|uniref:CLUMA_CG015748, isoform A n=1 Tax=Clunio marinus TaxID=568069 RepID=A0A1J1IRK5_9DIPT|nr:CLUMA_CG015748, isoform A [Clunio marinus]
MWNNFIVLTVLFYTLRFIDGKTQFELNFERSTNRIVITDYYYKLEYSVIRDDREIQSVTLGTGPGGFVKATKSPHGLILSGRGDEIEMSIEVDESGYSQFSVTRRNIRQLFISNLDGIKRLILFHHRTSTEDCVDLGNATKVNWFGGNQQRHQYYPIQNMTHKHNSYVTKAVQNQAIAERYWLNSNGIFIRVDNDAPLFIDQHNENEGFMCLQAKRALPYDIYHRSFDFKYHVGIGLNARDAHMQAVKRFLGKPSGHPDEKMVEQPIWSTWARYKRDVNEGVVMEFAQEIINNGFTGQLELDDDWEICYGSLTFNKQKFPDIKDLTDKLHTIGFNRITLWIHPFVNKNCEPYYTNAKRKGHFLTNRQNSTDTSWWNSEKNEAAYLDFTKTEVSKWFHQHLTQLLASSGVDSYKFDAGESSWGPVDFILNATSNEYPMKLTSDYVRSVSRFGSLVEIRSGSATQDLPVFVRMIDKDTEWSLDNGLPTLITTLLELNMVGYPLVLPDMIGGNGYNVEPDKEMFLRWLQANTFMPSLQFSYVPWQYDQEAIDISHTFVNLHAQYTPYIMERFKQAVMTGEPVNPPIWWIAPKDPIAQEVNDEFLLGELILAAPVVTQDAVKRDVYLPAGIWEDGNTGEVHNTESGKWIRDYPAPLNILPYFIKK